MWMLPLYLHVNQRSDDDDGGGDDDVDDYCNNNYLHLSPQLFLIWRQVYEALLRAQNEVSSTVGNISRKSNI